MTRMHLYQVIGRKIPTATDASPKAYRMKLFAPNEVVAKSRFWYFLRQARKIKKTTGEVLSCNEISEKSPVVIKNFGIWIRYHSRSGIHNIYKEFRDVSLCGAVDQLYAEMAGSHRARFSSIHILRTEIVEKPRKPQVIQFNGTVKFALPHRVVRRATKSVGNKLIAHRPSTYHG